MVWFDMHLLQRSVGQKQENQVQHGICLQGYVHELPELMFPLNKLYLEFLKIVKDATLPRNAALGRNSLKENLLDSCHLPHKGKTLNNLQVEKYLFLFFN